MNSIKLITIDGPSASGKSSVSRLLAKKIQWPWVSTGAFYRGLALSVLESKTPESDSAAVLDLANSLRWQVHMTPEDTEVFLDQNNVTSLISGEEVGATASRISQIPAVRAALLQRQRDCFQATQGLIAEGRDCGTVVFPHAPVKIFLTATPAQRALRRSEESSANLQETLELQKQRDQQDSLRKAAPLKIADGALQIDSSFLTLEEVVTEIIAYARSRTTL